MGFAEGASKHPEEDVTTDSMLAVTASVSIKLCRGSSRTNILMYTRTGESAQQQVLLSLLFRCMNKMHEQCGTVIESASANRHVLGVNVVVVLWQRIYHPSGSTTVRDNQPARCFVVHEMRPI